MRNKGSEAFSAFKPPIFGHHSMEIRTNEHIQFVSRLYLPFFTQNTIEKCASPLKGLYVHLEIGFLLRFRVKIPICRIFFVNNVRTSMFTFQSRYRAEVRGLEVRFLNLSTTTYFV